MAKYKIRIEQKEFEVTLLEKSGNSVTFSLDGKTHQVNVEPVISNSQNSTVTSAPTRSGISKKKTVSAKTNEITAPMPGIIIKIAVKVGQEVSAGDVLVVMEAMKMENNISAHKDGKIKTIHVKEGQEVSNSQPLIELARIFHQSPLRDSQL